jgi:hypothetical protein
MTPLRTRIDRLLRPLVARRGVLRVVGTVLVLAAVGFLAWRIYGEWRLGYIILTNEGPPLTVQVLDEAGKVMIGKPFSLGANVTLALPDGEYRLSVNGVGRLGQTFRLAINRGETIVDQVSLDEGRLLGSEGPPLRKSQERAEGGTRAGVEPKTRRPQGQAINLGFEPIRPVQHADLDGDGEPDVLAVGLGTTKSQPLAAFSAGGRALWTATITAPYISYTSLRSLSSPPDWPWLVDLDSDGACEVVVPDSGPFPLGVGGWGLRVLDGATGQTRWARPMGPETSEDDGVAHLAEAPDLDGDGIRDIVVVSLFKGRQPSSPNWRHVVGPGSVYVDALSGRDGRLLWFWTRDLPSSHFALTWAPRWWGRGPDGWPLLAVPIGGKPQTEQQQQVIASPFLWPIVHILEGSTGREMHTIPGLCRPEATDLDDDGLDDLWGEVDGQLRAFRGQPPEAWRAIGRFTPASEARLLEQIRTGHSDANGLLAPSHDFTRFHRASDFDGDGIGDVLIDELVPDGVPQGGATVSQTAIARSGRDGHLIWKAVLDPPPFWEEPNSARGIPYELASFPLPEGDLDRDGTPDVIATRNDTPPWLRVPALKPSPPAPLPLQALSGRTGRRLWSAGPLPPGSAPGGVESVGRFDSLVLDLIDRKGAPDVLVEYSTPYHGPPSPSLFASGEGRMARLSGRDGRVVWDVAVAEPERATAGSAVFVPRLTIPRRYFGDLNGDGFLDVILVDSPAANGMLSFGGGQGITLQAFSLKDGVKLWTHRFPITRDGPHQLLLAVGDIDGNGRAEVLVANAAQGDDWRDQRISELNALNGPDGRVLWTWKGRDRFRMDFHGLWLARVEGGRRQVPCVAMGDDEHWWRLVMLDAQGGVSADRESPSPHTRGLEPADLDGDGNDELLVSGTDGLSILGPDLKETGRHRHLKAPDGLWCQAPGQPGSVVAGPVLGLDGPKWQPLRGNLTGYEGDHGPWLLHPGDAERRPYWMVATPDETVCRSAPPILPSGRYAPPRGTPVPPGLARDDPRWARPWPWIEPIRRVLDPRLLMAVIGLAMINVIVPIALIRLVARRRRWTIRLLMALPVAVAVPLTAFQTRDSVLPVEISPIPTTGPLAFVLGTLAGLPIVLYAGLACLSLFRRQWRRLLALIGLTIVSTAIVGAAWLRNDSRAMPAIEYYSRSEWYLAAVPGAYAAGVLIPVAWTLRAAYRLLRRPRRAEVEAA